MADITFTIEEFIGVIQKQNDGWSKELNLVKWNDHDAKYDIREWNEDHSRMTRGITLTPSEMRRVVKFVEGRV